MVRSNRFNGMMHEYCVGLGFCGGMMDEKPTHVTDFIPETGQVSAQQFVHGLLNAEGLDGHSDDWGLKAVFIRHMGTDFVDAIELRSSFRGS
jgi:hypothetical protein